MLQFYIVLEMKKYEIFNFCESCTFSPFSPPPTSKETASQRSRHAPRHVRHARAVMHVGIANPGWRGKFSQHSRHMRNPQLHVSGNRPIVPADWLVPTGARPSAGTVLARKLHMLLWFSMIPWHLHYCGPMTSSEIVVQSREIVRHWYLW